VFEIKGNDFILVAIIILVSKKVFKRLIGTHSEYDKIDCKNLSLKIAKEINKKLALNSAIVLGL
jgi:hypothetical protein